MAKSKKSATVKAKRKSRAKKAKKKSRAKERAKSRASTGKLVVIRCAFCRKSGPIMTDRKSAVQAAEASGFVVGRKRAACGNCASTSVELN